MSDFNGPYEKIDKSKSLHKTSYKELQQQIILLEETNKEQQKQIHTFENKCLSQQHEIKRINNAFEHSMNQLRAASEHSMTAVQMINKLQKENNDLQSQLDTAQIQIDLLTETLKHNYYNMNKNDKITLTQPCIHKSKSIENNSIIKHIESIEKALDEWLNKNAKKTDKYDNIRYFDIFNKQKWKISNDKCNIIGIDDIGFGPWFIYGENKLNGYKKGIHIWSVKCIYGSKQCQYKGIGVISEMNKELTVYECQEWGLIGFGSYYSYYDSIWNDGEIITVVLNCNQWNVKYYIDCKQVKSQKIKANKSYYFALCSFGFKEHNIKYQCVKRPDFRLSIH
eukprot:259776_1